ncbi:tetraspanin-8 [Hippoglossus stenolepis]|uniref:tetraspanin-8 n=1 Tax=Hippoglossus stenolepis TaxID=195615 RepID=UPI00159C82E3|nr:tetraspanin-8 [Hippoglossus stenolepis]
MAQINTCLKWTFTIFNIFFAIFGAIVILIPLISQVYIREDVEGRTTGLIVLYVLGSVTLIIAVLGAYGAHRENKVCLILFLVCMVVGSLVMLRIGVVAAFARPQLTGFMSEKFRSLLPLDTSSDVVKNMAETMQTQLQCCGFFSYQDWEDNIPDSCLCSSEAEEEGMCQSVSYNLQSLFQGKRIYTKTCFPIVMQYVLVVVDVVIGIVFSLATLALLGMILSSIMIHQLRYPNRTTVLMVPSIFTTAPPKYQELHNSPNY